MAEGAAETLSLGDIQVVKEWTFAGDVAAAMLTLVGQEKVFEAAIGSGEGHSIEAWLDACFTAVGHDWRGRVELKPGFQAEYPSLVSDPTTIMSLGWRPRVNLNELAEMMVKPAQTGER